MLQSVVSPCVSLIAQCLALSSSIYGSLESVGSDKHKHSPWLIKQEDSYIYRIIYKISLLSDEIWLIYYQTLAERDWSRWLMRRAELDLSCWAELRPSDWPRLLCIGLKAVNSALSSNSLSSYQHSVLITFQNITFHLPFSIRLHSTLEDQQSPSWKMRFSTSHS